MTSDNEMFRGCLIKSYDKIKKIGRECHKVITNYVDDTVPC